MKEVIYTREIIIGILMLIILSLSLTLINSGINFLPNWLLKIFLTGTFTIIGVTLGANLAAKNALKVVFINKQNEDDKTKERHLRNQQIIIEHGDELINYLGDHDSTLDNVFDFDKVSDIKINLKFLNANSYNIQVLLDELISINSYDLDQKHDYYFRQIRKTCKILKSNLFLSSSLEDDFKPSYTDANHMFQLNNISVGFTQTKTLINQIREISI